MSEMLSPVWICVDSWLSSCSGHLLFLQCSVPLVPPSVGRRPRYDLPFRSQHPQVSAPMSFPLEVSPDFCPTLDTELLPASPPPWNLSWLGVQSQPGNLPPFLGGENKPGRGGCQAPSRILFILPGMLAEYCIPHHSGLIFYHVPSSRAGYTVAPQ